jgi:putative ABC transport system permease protein
VVAQIALTVVLVFGAAITARAFVALLNVPLGFDPTNVLTVSIRQRPGEPPAYERILQGIRARPDVVTAGAVGIGQAPFEGGSPFDHVQTDDGAVFGGLRHALPGYLEALGLRLVRGRTLTWDDYREAGNVAVLTESAAEALVPDGDALGRTFTNSGRNRTLRVIGVIADLRHRTERDPQPAVYALPQDLIRPLSLVIRTTHRSENLLQQLRQVVRDEVPGARVTATWYADSISSVTAFRNPRFQTIVLTTLSGVALVLTMAGIVGVVGNLVASRTKELAVRAAVGATPMRLILLIVGQVIVPVSSGVAIGLVGTRWASGFAEAQLFAVDTTGVTALASTVAVVLAAALVAALVPSRRAGRVDPVVALRAE